ncbi:MAG: hypothetical protein K0S07_1449 [Chlamydiales bacterium]|jgi:hypothetical protein|nr:hypothetical protein [Chlamydiales bacterium]
MEALRGEPPEDEAFSLIAQRPISHELKEDKEAPIENRLTSLPNTD